MKGSGSYSSDSSLYSSATIRENVRRNNAQHPSTALGGLPSNRPHRTPEERRQHLIRVLEAASAILDEDDDLFTTDNDTSDNGTTNSTNNNNGADNSTNDDSTGNDNNDNGTNHSSTPPPN